MADTFVCTVRLWDEHYYNNVKYELCCEIVVWNEVVQTTVHDHCTELCGVYK